MDQPVPANTGAAAITVTNTGSDNTAGTQGRAVIDTNGGFGQFSRREATAPVNIRVNQLGAIGQHNMGSSSRPLSPPTAPLTAPSGSGRPSSLSQSDAEIAELDEAAERIQAATIRAYGTSQPPRPSPLDADGEIARHFAANNTLSAPQIGTSGVTLVSRFASPVASPVGNSTAASSHSAGGADGAVGGSQLGNNGGINASRYAPGNEGGEETSRSGNEGKFNPLMKSETQSERNLS
jgi:hypothetical protein